MNYAPLLVLGEGSSFAGAFRENKIMGLVRLLGSAL
jgi:hypothetical protein